MKALKIVLLLIGVTLGLSSCIVPVGVGGPGYRGGYGRPGYYGGPRYHSGPRYHGGPRYNGGGPRYNNGGGGGGRRNDRGPGRYR